MASIVIELEEEDKDLVRPIEALLKEVRRARRAGPTGRAVEYAELERKISKRTAEIEQAAHRVILGALDVDAERVLVDGARHRRVGRHEATYYTLAGPVVVTRSVYRREGDRNGRVVDPVSLRAGTVGDGWLPQTARAMAHHLQRGTSREAEACAQEMGRLPYSRSSFERVGHDVAEVYGQNKDAVDEVLISEYEVPPSAVGASISIDRVSVPMEEPRVKSPGRPKKGAAKRPVERVYRMAYVGAVTLHDAAGEAVHTIRYGCMPHRRGADLCRAMIGDVQALLEKRDLSVSLLSDGAHELVDLLRANAPLLDVPVVQLIDFWHLIEKLGRAARVIAGEEAAASALLRRWKMALLNRQWAALKILRELRDSGCKDVRVGDGRPVHDAITYIDGHQSLMNYAAARAEGRPIGSGGVEATCKTLVAIRMKRAGARWKSATGEHILQLRSLAQSDRWDAGMRVSLRTLRRSVRAA